MRVREKGVGKKIWLFFLKRDAWVCFKPFKKSKHNANKSKRTEKYLNNGVMLWGRCRKWCLRIAGKYVWITTKYTQWTQTPAFDNYFRLEWNSKILSRIMGLKLGFENLKNSFFQSSKASWKFLLCCLWFEKTRKRAIGYVFNSFSVALLPRRIQVKGHSIAEFSSRATQ